jgi:4-amino-4-deoxy-L-arabinose transferase-like glycosyltransferase
VTPGVGEEPIERLETLGYLSSPRGTEPAVAGNPSESSRRTAFLAAALIFSTALALRLTYLVLYARSPLFDAPGMDPGYHVDWALDIATRSFIGTEVYFRAPLYPYLLSAFFWIFGKSSSTFMIIHAVQLVVGAANCVLLYRLATRIYGLRVGLVAGLIASLYWIFIYFEGEFLFPVLLIFLLLTAFSFLMDAVESRSLSHFFASGLFFGLFAITRPNILVFIPFLLLWLHFLDREEGLRSRFWKGAAAMVGAIVLCVAPVTLRNYLVSGDFVLISSQGGLNFYIGNNPSSDGARAFIPGEFIGADWESGYREPIELAEREAGRALTPSEASKFWTNKGLAFLRDQPGKAFRLYVRKLRLLFNGSEIPNNRNIHFFAEYSGFLNLPFFINFWMLAPIGVAGVLFTPRNRWWWLLVGFMVVYLGSFLPFFVTSRYRTIALPFLIIMASVFLVRFYDTWRERDWARLLGAGGTALVLSVMLHLNDVEFPGARVDQPSSAHYALARAFFEKGEFEKAVPHFEMSERLVEPFGSSSLKLLGHIYIEGGDAIRGLDYFERAVSREPSMLRGVGAYLIEENRLMLLEELLEKVEQEDARLLHRLADEFAKRGDYSRAEKYYLKVLKHRPESAVVIENLERIRSGRSQSPPP